MASSDEDVGWEINDIMKKLVTHLASMIPDVGAIISLILDLFWPEKKHENLEDIWSKILKEIQKMAKEIADVEILKRELSNAKAKLDGMRDNMKLYLEAKGAEKGDFLVSMITNGNVIWREFTETTDGLQLIAPATVIANMNLSLYRERYLHGKTMFEHPNEKVWFHDLNEAYNKYHAYFVDVFDKWEEWRYKFMSEKYGSHKGGGPFESDIYISTAEVKDDREGENRTWRSQELGMKIPDFYKEVANNSFTEMKTNVAKDMAGVLEPSFYLKNYLPGHEKDRPNVNPKLKSMWLGIYSVVTLGAESVAREPMSTPIRDSPGIVNQVYIRAYNSVDFLQFTYDEHSGHGIGNSGGGAPHTFTFDDKKHFTGMKMGFAGGLLCNVQVAFSDGSLSKWVGNLGNWHPKMVNAICPPSYEIACGRFNSGPGPSSTTGVACVELFMRHLSLRDVKH